MEQRVIITPDLARLFVVYIGDGWIWTNADGAVSGTHWRLRPTDGEVLADYANWWVKANTKRLEMADGTMVEVYPICAGAKCYLWRWTFDGATFVRPFDGHAKPVTGMPWEGDVFDNYATWKKAHLKTKVAEAERKTAEAKAEHDRLKTAEAEARKAYWDADRPKPMTPAEQAAVLAMRRDGVTYRFDVHGDQNEVRTFGGEEQKRQLQERAEAADRKNRIPEDMIPAGQK